MSELPQEVRMHCNESQNRQVIYSLYAQNVSWFQRKIMLPEVNVLGLKSEAWSNQIRRMHKTT